MLTTSKITEFESALMSRDGETREEAALIRKECMQRVCEGENPEDILFDEFGLEPDYIFDIMP